MGPFVDSEHPQIKQGTANKLLSHIFQEEIRMRVNNPKHSVSRALSEGVLLWFHKHVVALYCCVLYVIAPLKVHESHQGGLLSASISYSL